MVSSPMFLSLVALCAVWLITWRLLCIMVFATKQPKRSSLGYGPESSASRAVCTDTDFCFS